METCLDCESSMIINDPDPNDWFCDDDVAVVCILEKNPKQNLSSEYMSDHNSCRCITRSCRPYRVKKETNIPSWCPMEKK